MSETRKNTTSEGAEQDVAIRRSENVTTAKQPLR